MYNQNAFPANHLLEYQKWVGTNRNKAIALCTLNVDVSEALYPTLNMFEITLRDSINRSFIDYYGINWHFQDLVKYHTKSHRKSVISTIIACKKNFVSEEVLNNNIVAEMNLYYWSNILDPINSHMWKKKGIKPIFHTRSRMNQFAIFREVNKLRKLRNRIAHLKSIIQRNLRSDYDNCRELIDWLSHDALTWCDSKSRFLNIHPNSKIIVNDFISPDLDLTPWMQFIKGDAEQNNI